MTIVTQFSPSNTAPFQFSPVLDGNAYNVVVTWSLFGRRYFVNVYQLDGTLIVCLPLIGSVGSAGIKSLAWSNNKVTVTTVAPHGYRVTSTAALTMSGCVPDAYNGKRDCAVTGPSTFTFLLASNPGPFTQLGVVSYDISLVAGYFTSTMVFREAAQQFEVSP